MAGVRVLACPDKFRGTATASEVADAIAAGAEDAGASTLRQPLADGGEGALEAFGGPNRTTTVTGPLGTPVEAAWRLRDGVAVIVFIKYPVSGKEEKILLISQYRPPVASAVTGREPASPRPDTSTPGFAAADQVRFGMFGSEIMTAPTALEGAPATV